MRDKNQTLKNFLRKHLYRHEQVHRMNRKVAVRDGDSGRARVISDYISGMTDRYAIAEHQRIFNEGIF